MKKYASFLFVFILVLLIPVSCMAESSVTIDELGLSLSMPNKTYVITRETEATSTVWDAFTWTQEDFIKYLTDNNIYVDTIARDGSYEIVLIGRQGKNYDEIFNLSLFKDEEILKLLSSSTSSAGKLLGLTIDSEEIYNSGSVKYFVFSGTQATEKQTVYIKSYITVVNANFIQISFRSYNGPLSKLNETTIKYVVDSIEFKEILSKSTASSSNSSSNASSASSSKSSSSTLYKALVGGVIALIIGGISAVFKASNKDAGKEKDAESTHSDNKQEIATIPDNTLYVEHEKHEVPLDDTPIIFFCKECQAVFGGTLKVKPEKCPKCGGVVVETTVLRDDWRSLTNEGKIQLKKELSEGRHWKDSTLPEPIEAEKTSTDVDESKTDKSVNQQLFHLKSLKDAGIITQEEFDAKKKQILGL